MMQLIRVALVIMWAVLTVLKVTAYPDLSWWLVFAPLYPILILFGFGLVALCVHLYMMKTSAEYRTQHAIDQLQKAMRRSRGQSPWPWVR